MPRNAALTAGLLWAAAICAASGAFAQPATNDLKATPVTLMACVSAQRDAAAQCEAYVAGVGDADAADRRFLHIAPWICPGAATPAQGAQVVRSYLEHHPAVQISDPASLVLIALAGAFPCLPSTTVPR